MYSCWGSSWCVWRLGAGEMRRRGDGEVGLLEGVGDAVQQTCWFSARGAVKAVPEMRSVVRSRGGL